MSIDSHAARVTRRDVTDLAVASEQLVVAADTIRRMKPNWGEAVVNLLIAANLTIERIQNKGAAAFARYLQKHGPQSPQDVPEAAAAGEDANQAPIERPEPEEA